MGKRVCLIDCDPQANMTIVLGYPQPNNLPVTLPDIIQDLINSNLKPEKSVLLQKREYILRGFDMDFIPSNIKLSGIENLLMNEINREVILKKIISGIKDDYDYILLDTMPSISLITINALNAANSVIIPMQPQYLSAKGLELLLSTIERIKDGLNPNLNIDGVLITMYDNRLILHKEMVDVINEAFAGLRIFETKIPVSVRIAETQAKSVNIFDYSQSEKISEIYEQFTKEYLNNEQ
jgi:chromosome partitioning protein